MVDPLATAFPQGNLNLDGLFRVFGAAPGGDLFGNRSPFGGSMFASLPALRAPRGMRAALPGSASLPPSPALAPFFGVRAFPGMPPSLGTPGADTIRDTVTPPVVPPLPPATDPALQ